MTNTLDGPPALSYLRTLPESECYELLAVATVGRVGFVSPAGVQILPVNFRLGPGHQTLREDQPSRNLGPAGSDRCSSRLRGRLSRA